VDSGEGRVDVDEVRAGVARFLEFALEKGKKSQSPAKMRKREEKDAPAVYSEHARSSIRFALLQRDELVERDRQVARRQIGTSFGFRCGEDHLSIVKKMM
jgi:hypothetical protein